MSNAILLLGAYNLNEFLLLHLFVLHLIKVIQLLGILEADRAPAGPASIAHAEEGGLPDILQLLDLLGGKLDERLVS